MYKSRTHLYVNEKFVSSHVNTSFNLTKIIHCHSDVVLKQVKEKLDRLAEENFNRVRIPEFSYEIVDDKTISYNVRFIKGVGIGTAIPYLQKIVKEDVLERKSDWTFSDYHTGNFLMDCDTGDLYAVDFLSYCYAPDRKWRKERWDLSLYRDREIWDKMMGGWNYSNKWTI